MKGLVKQSHGNMGKNVKEQRIKSSPRIGLCWSSQQYKKLHANNTTNSTHKKIKQRGATWEEITIP
jgi:hypothetical protein